MSFKLIGIKAHEKCNENIRKILKPDLTYLFYNNYAIENDIVTKSVDELPDNLYRLTENIEINISAVVGKNGSGKSTVLDILYISLYMISWELGLLATNPKSRHRFVKSLRLHATIYYEINNDFYSLICEGTTIIMYLQKNGERKRTKIKGPTLNKRDYLFYTVASNYSHYSLNSKHQNTWLSDIFQKNDGYQIPLVLNPYKNSGVVDINNEESLALQRILVNLLVLKNDEEQLLQELSPGRIVSSFKFRVNKQKVSFYGIDRGIKKVLTENRNAIINAVIEAYNLENAISLLKSEKVINEAYNYIITKLFKISRKYRPFQKAEFQFIVQLNSKKSNKASNPYSFEFNIKALYTLLAEIKEKPSHITFKFEQAINFIENFPFYQTKIGIPQEIKAFSQEINKLAKEKKKRIITLIPPSFFDIEIRFTNNSLLEGLSSGEKQRIYSSSSWIYHLLNLISVQPDLSSGYTRYRNINLIFDEIELYYHPEMQRTFIKDFTENLARISVPKDVSINCIFITHSPFILSDIPNQNILFLNDDGTPDEVAKEFRTFGSNIHELLKNNFFLQDGTIGAFAQQRINALIEYLELESTEYRNWDRTTADKFINMVSEPIIRTALRDLFKKKFGENKTEIEKQIHLLQAELAGLKKKKK